MMQSRLARRVAGRLRRGSAAAGRLLLAAGGQPAVPAPSSDPAGDGYVWRPAARHGWGRPPHPELMDLLQVRRAAMLERLRGFRRFLPQLMDIPLEESSPEAPWWGQRWYTGLDATSLYATLAERDPARLVEVGSGASTRFARRAIRDHGLRTRITSIDPAPRQEVDAICDVVVRSGLEDVDIDALARDLYEGDIFFLDGSHRALMNSDVTVALLELLPRLRPGVLVQVHDVLLPWDYPQVWAPRRYSEQYVLAAWLLARGPLLEVDLANHMISVDPEMHAVLAPLWEWLGAAGCETNGVGMWLRRAAPGG